MFLPFYRGEESWPVRAQAVAYAKNTEYLSQVYRNNPPLDSGLNLPVSDIVYKYIASKPALTERFGECFDGPRNMLRCSITRMCLDASQCTQDVLQYLGADFDFSTSLYMDQAFFRNKLFHDLIGPRIFQRTSILSQNRLLEGFANYQSEDYLGAYHHFSNAYELDSSLYPIQYRIGLLKLNHPELVDEEGAFSAFRLAGIKAERDGQKEFAAHCYVHASYCAYLLARDGTSLELSQKALSLYPGLREAIYLNAKILSLSDQGTSITRLDTLVHMNRNYALRIGADKDMDSVREAFFSSLKMNGEQEADPIREEFRRDVQNVKRIEQNLTRHGQIVSQLGLDRKFFHRFHEDSEELDSIYGRHTYFDYKLFIDRYQNFQKHYRTHQFLRQLQFGPSYIADNTPDLDQVNESISDLQQRAKAIKLFLSVILSLFIFFVFSSSHLSVTPLSISLLLASIFIILYMMWPEEFMQITWPLRRKVLSLTSPKAKPPATDLGSKKDKDWMRWVVWLNFLLLAIFLIKWPSQTGLRSSFPLFLIILILSSVLSLFLVLRYLKRQEDALKRTKEEIEMKIREYFTPPK